MTGQEAIEYIEQYGWSKTRLGLERTQELLERVGNPQKELRFIHVAGSNGKGSVCAMLDAILREAGYRTGLYTSPYLTDFCERIRVDGQNIPPEALAAVTEVVRDAAEAMTDHPSQFELVTAAAMLYFARTRCDIVVLEVGMGGALDSTNAIDAPLAAVITNIGLEHTEYLGHTVEEIAQTKAGIIKPGCAAVCYDGDSAVRTVLKTVCAEKGVPLYETDSRRLTCESAGLHGQDIRWDGRGYHLALLGEYQLGNAALVLQTVETLRERGLVLSDEAVKKGLANVRWPARLELLEEGPLFLLDGGHNPQCAEALARSLRALLPGRRFVFLVGILADKDRERMIDAVAPLAECFVCLTPDSERALDAEELARYLRERGLQAKSCRSAREGLRSAHRLAGPHGAIVCFGSLYMAGGVRQLMLNK